MKLKRQILFLGTLAILLFAGSTGAFAQEPQPEPTATPEAVSNQQPKGDGRFDMLRQLGLSREQMQRIRRMNQERKPLVDAAQTKFREALKALDDAIYADEVDEETFKARLKDVQLAQAELHRVRFLNELGIRRVLTLAQLAQFRELRRQFAEKREAAAANGGVQNRPIRDAIRQMRSRPKQAAPPNENTKQQ